MQKEESIFMRKTLHGEEEDGVCSNPGKDLLNMLERRAGRGST
jgi:hypothetical protein